MDSFLRKQLRVVLAAALFACVAGVHAQGPMPTVTPISSVPQGPAPGGGVVTRVTYEMKLAANDAGVAGASNDARYVSRAVTIAGPTMGGIVRGVVAGGLRLAGWVGVALLAYDAYKWYTDNGVLTAPGDAIPALDCGGGGYFSDASWHGGQTCSLAYMQVAWTAYWKAAWPNATSWNTPPLCLPAIGNACNTTWSAVLPNGVTTTQLIRPWWHASGAPAGTSDPTYTTNPTPVTDAQLGDLAQQHPEWWPDMLRDPETGQPLVTPEIADDMNALRHQIAPDYGVDPTTLPDVQPDPDYLTGKAVPREQAIPEYCAWASAACNYYKFVQDNWPDKQGEKQVTDSPDCVAPPSCSGDVVMCAVVRNTWAGKCATAGDPSVTRPVFGEHKVAELDQPDVDVGDTSQLDQTGFGWGGACPFTDLGIDFGGQHVGVSVAAVCEYGPWMRAFILILAGLKCAEIMAGLRVAAE
jgi:hypothetical protein